MPTSKQTLISSNTFEAGESGAFTIEYLRTERLLSGESAVYGVALKKSTADGSKQEIRELTLTDSIEHINGIIDSLIQNMVTTAGVDEVIDFIYDKTFPVA